MTGSQRDQLDLNGAGVRGLIGFSRPGTDGLSQHTRAGARATLRKQRRVPYELHITLPGLPTLRIVEGIAHDLIGIPQRLGGQLQLSCVAASARSRASTALASTPD
jgi:hypothetical protein